MGSVALVASTVNAAPEAQVAIADWWVPGHAYTVMNYDESSGVVTLRNPWGTRPGPDGVFSLPFAMFEESFEYISYSGR